MQYTLRNIPKVLDDELRRRAREQNKSLNQVVLEALKRAVGLVGEPVRQRDLSDVAATWVSDPDIDAALEEQRRVDVDLWR